MSRYVVVLATGSGSPHVYGPIDDQEMAQGFAEFMTDQVDPATCVKLIDPLDELLAFWRNRAPRIKPVARPVGWPPTAGEVWQDRDGNRWISVRIPNHPEASYLTCIARPADEGAEEIWRLYGPMQRVHHVPVTLTEEAPF